MQGVRRAALLLQLPSSLIVVYLDVLALAAALWRPRRAAISPRHRFCFIIPAHDEEILLPRLLRSVRALEYPRDLFDVHVVADNCTDSTAQVAAVGGAVVHTRSDSIQQGKGYAVRWLLNQIAESGREFDGYVFVDADSVVSSDLLRVFDAHLAHGDQAMQCYYGVLNASDSWTAAIRFAAFALFNCLRPRGRDKLGLSAGLRGNGMCFSHAILQQFGWDAYTLAEDAEFHLQLVERGIRVAYAAPATVLAEMPVTLRQARSQNMRWERGRLLLLGKHGPALLREAIVRRDLARLDALAEQLVPPLSVLAGMGVVGCVVAAASGYRPARYMAVLNVVGQALYVATGLRLVRAGPKVFVSMLLSPVYVAWKIWLYIVAAANSRDTRWIRTERRRPGLEAGRS